jgi:hypothetical protein
LESEKCPVCGIPVKKENLRAHYQKVHPRKISSLSPSRTVTAVGSGSVFHSHKRRNVLILALIVIATIGVSVAAAQFVKSNTLVLHIHPQLSITSVTVPAQIGIDPSLWKDHSLDQYGTGGLSPIHTHDTSGTIHVESNTARNFTLHEFLAIWGQPSDGSTINGKQVISLTVDNQAQATTQDVVFKDLQKIVIVTS